MQSNIPSWQCRNQRLVPKRANLNKNLLHLLLILGSKKSLHPNFLAFLDWGYILFAILLFAIFQKFAATAWGPISQNEVHVWGNLGRKCLLPLPPVSYAGANSSAIFITGDIKLLSKTKKAVFCQSMTFSILVLFGSSFAIAFLDGQIIVNLTVSYHFPIGCESKHFFGLSITNRTLYNQHQQ